MVIRNWLVGLLMAVLLAASGAAQVSMNGIGLVNANGTATNNTVVSQPGGQVTMRNDFSVNIVVQLRDANGTVLAEETVEPGTETRAHGQGAGSCEIWAFQAGQPGTA